MIRRPPRSTPFPTRRSSDLSSGCSSITRSTFSTTTIASSTTMPIASTMASSETEFEDRKSTRLNSSHPSISYAVFCLKKKKKKKKNTEETDINKNQKHE